MHGKPGRIVSILSHSIYVFLYILSLLIFPSAVQAEREGIQKIWSWSSHLTWIGNISSSINTLSITVNGNPLASNELSTNHYKGSAHIRIPLEYNMSNLITIKEGGNILFNADLFYAPTYEAELVPDEYESNPFHVETNEKPCLSCHRLRIKESDKMPGKPSEKICFPCHSDEFSGLAFQHSSAGVNWECLRCHQDDVLETDDLTDSPVKFIIREGLNVAPLCYQCHKEEEKERSEHKHLHSLIAMGTCTICHNPHGSNDKNFVRREISTICIDCHAMQNMLKKQNVHDPVIKKGCTACHDPHSNNFSFRLNGNVKDSCLKCHAKTEKQKSNHPTTGHPVYGDTDPHNSDRPFTCTSCHNPHASEYDNFLAVENITMLCIKCHPEYRL